MEPLSKFLEYIFQVTGGLALSMRSIIVGTHFTGEEVNGPLPFLSGTHEGTLIQADVGDDLQGATRFELQPQPGPGSTPGAGSGLSPLNPLTVAATRLI